MFFLSVRLDNVYMFRDFFLDFTMARKSSHFLAKHDALFEGSKIYVRKKLLILGANASGKTTFGRILCAIQNYLVGREMGPQINLLEKRYDQTKPGMFQVDFAIGEYAYRMRCVYDERGVKTEGLKVVKIFPSYTNKVLCKRLDDADYVTEYERPVNAPVPTILGKTGMVSSLLLRQENETYLTKFRDGIQFSYIFSDFASTQSSLHLQESVERLNHILPKIDNSVERIVSLKSEDSKLISHSYVIVFKNGQQMTIPDGDLNRADRTRLSHGTYEALQFLDFLTNVKNNPEMVAFIDEQLAHLHAELEAYLIMKALLVQRNGQIFCTTHNPELLDLNIAPQMVLLFRRTEDGFNEALYVSDRIKKNDRGFKGYYDNDFFGVLPDYSVLDKYFEED